MELTRPPCRCAAQRNPAYFCEPGFGPPTNGPVPAGPDSWNDYMFPFDPKLRGCIPASYEQADGSFVTEWVDKAPRPISPGFRILPPM